MHPGQELKCRGDHYYELAGAKCSWLYSKDREMNERAQELMQLQGIKATEQTEMENE